jgi:hypothetical protein
MVYDRSKGYALIRYFVLGAGGISIHFASEFIDKCNELEA